MGGTVRSTTLTWLLVICNSALKRLRLVVRLYGFSVSLERLAQTTSRQAPSGELGAHQEPPKVTIGSLLFVHGALQR